MRALATVLAAILVIAAGTACAGDDAPEDEAAPAATADAVEPAATEPAFTLTEPAATEPAETRPEAEPDQSRWAAEVDAACREWQERLDALEPPQDAAALEGFLAEALPLIRKQVAAVEAVSPPEDAQQADEAKLLVAGMRRVADALGRYRTALAQGNAGAAQTAIAEAGAAGTDARERARALGVTACGGYPGG